MRKAKLPPMVTIVAACIVFALPVAAQVKIGVVDMERAIVQSVDGKKAEATFTARFDTLRKTIEAKQKQIEDTQNKLKTQDRLLDDNVKASMTKDVARFQTELARIQEDAQRELDTLRGNLMRPIAQVADTALQGLGKDEGFTLIIDSSNPRNSSLMFVNSAVDLTDILIRRIDAESLKKKP